MTPSGTKFLECYIPSHRKSFDTKREEGWYIGPAMKHYQCYKIFSKRTHAIRTPPKVKYYLYHCKMQNDSKKNKRGNQAINKYNKQTST